jgi:hypothetical protein
MTILMNLLNPHIGAATGEVKIEGTELASQIIALWANFN